MAPDRWRKVEELYHAARERDATLRAAFLHEACAGDDALRREVESLLAQDAQAASFLEASPVKNVAAQAAHEAKLFENDPAESQEDAPDVSHEQSPFDSAPFDSVQGGQDTLIGRQLGSYLVREKIGEGGMGEVYRGFDTKLRRDVALKVLPRLFARDPERLARFRREAQLLASLNHKNIAAIYGFEETPEANFLVLELVEGKTFAELVLSGVEGRIKRQGPLPVKDALALASQVAEGLEAAHRKGITHRDIKPANIKVTPEGEVKVLDFGLAKAFEGDRANANMSELPTLEPGPTKDGQILGTPAYMSPEQVRGQEVDKRTDIWAFGCVLYLLLTGKQAFRRETLTDTVAAVLEHEPDWTALPSTTHTAIRTLLRRCLQKDANQRLHDIADARIEIREVLAVPATSEPAYGKIPTRLLRRWAVRVGAAALALGILVGGLAVWNLRPFAPSPAPGPVTRFVMTLPGSERLWRGFTGSPLALSPDGTHLVYNAGDLERRQLYLRSLDSLEAKPIPGTEEAIGPFFSPDGQWLGFTDLVPPPFALKKVSINGGEPLTLCECVPNPRGISWGPDNTIVFAPSATSGIWRISASGGTPQVLTTLDSAKGEASHRWPELLPGGKALLFTVGSDGAWADAEIVVQRLDTGERLVLVQGGTHAHYLPTGHLVYLRQGTLMAVPFDLERLEVSGASIPVLEGISQEATNGSPRLSFSNLGSLAYLPASFGERTDATRLVWVDRQGAVQPLKAPPHPYVWPKLSPDGRRVVVGISEARSNIWVYNISGESLTRLTFEGSNKWAVWAGGGSRIAFSSGRAGPMSLFWKTADGTGVDERLTTSMHSQMVSSSFPDGKLLAFTDTDPDTGGGDIWVLPLEGERKPQAFLKTPFFEGGAMFSPDGLWLAYTSDESGRYEVYVQPFPATGAKWQVSTGGGLSPVWARNGRELFYRDNDLLNLMAVDINTRPTFSANSPRKLFEIRNVAQAFPPSLSVYDVSPDGQRFLFAQQDEPPPEPTPIHVVLNWFEELKRRVPTGQ